MKKLSIYLGSILILSFFSGCKKAEVKILEYYDETSIHSDDQARFSSEMDAVANDVNAILEMTPGFSGKPAALLGTICDAVAVIDTVSNPRTITLTYNAAACLSNRKRTGKIIISMDAGTRWKNAGAAINVSFVNFKVTRMKDKKDMAFIGKLLFTNESGGLLADLDDISKVTHTIFSADIDVFFDNGKDWSWKTARQRVYRQDNGIVITTTGTHAGGDITGIGYWGNNRYGNPFITPILIPLESRQDCNYRVVNGKIEIILTDRFYATAKLGLNESGNPIGCPGTSNYWLEVVWRGINGDRRTIRLPYE